jgi:hypothetical protein
VVLAFHPATVSPNPAQQALIYWSRGEKEMAALHVKVGGVWPGWKGLEWSLGGAHDWNSQAWRDQDSIQVGGVGNAKFAIYSPH